MVEKRRFDLPITEGVLRKRSTRVACCVFLQTKLLALSLQPILRTPPGVLGPNSYMKLPLEASAFDPLDPKQDEVDHSHVTVLTSTTCDSFERFFPEGSTSFPYLVEVQGMVSLHFYVSSLFKLRLIVFILCLGEIL